MPWKRIKVESQGKKVSLKSVGVLMQVPPDWLETDVQKGISDSEAEQRRKTTGWNELERYVRTTGTS